MFANNGARGYMEVAQQIIAQLPYNSKLGSMQSGALGYFAIEKDIEVHNLDGVVNGEAANFIQNKNIDEYIKHYNIEYFSDWDFNVFWLGSIIKNDSINLIPVFKAKNQLSDRFVIYKIISFDKNDTKGKQL